MYLKKIFVEIPKLSFVLSNKSFIIFLLTYFKILYFSITRKFFLKDIPLRFNFKFNDIKFFVTLKNNLDISILVEVFVLKEYEWKLDADINSVLDLGAHWGDTAIYYSLIYPNAKVTAVEPVPSVFKRLCVNAKQFKNILPIAGALSDNESNVDIYISDNTVGNSLTKRNQSTDVISVRGLTIEQIKFTSNIKKFSLVKFDIEGAESLLFKADLLNLADHYIGEIHLNMINETLDDIRAIFNGFEVSFDYLKPNRYILKASKLSE